MSPGLKLVPPGLALIGVTYGLARFAYGLFLPAIRADVGLTPTLAGLIGGGSYAGYCLAIIASVLLTDRLGPRNTAGLAGTVATLGMAAIALAPSPVLLAIAVLFAGTSTGLASPPLAGAVAARIGTGHQGRANTLINSGSSVGVALSGPIALVYVGAWREAYLLFAAVAACISPWVWLTLPARVPARDAVEPSVTFQALRRSAARPLLLAAFGTGAASAVYWTFAGEMMVAVGGLPASTTAVAWVVIGLAGFAGGAAGDLVRRHGVATIHRVSLTALAAAVLGIGLLPSSIGVAYAAAALFGAAYIMLTGVYLVWGVRVYADRPALGLGLPFLLLALGQVVGAPVAGIVVGTMGHPAAFALFAGIAAAAMLLRPVEPNIRPTIAREDATAAGNTDDVEGARTGA